MKSLILLIFLSSCVTTETKVEVTCPGVKMIGWKSPEETDDVDHQNVEIGKAKCLTEHKPYVCLYSLRMVEKPGAHRYIAICGLPKPKDD